jgi:hypothetical protein
VVEPDEDPPDDEPGEPDDPVFVFGVALDALLSLVPELDAEPEPEEPPSLLPLLFDEPPSLFPSLLEELPPLLP